MYDNLTTRLSALPGINFNEAITLELRAKDIQGNPADFKTVASTVITRFNNADPVAANDEFKLPLIGSTQTEPHSQRP